MRDDRQNFAHIVRIGLLLFGLLALLLRFASRHPQTDFAKARAREEPGANREAGTHDYPRRDSFPRLRKQSGPPASAEEIVAAKLVQFAASRRKLVSVLARRSGKAVPPEVERFFQALDRGHWEEADEIFEKLKRRHEQEEGPPAEDLYPIWRPLQETYGIQWEARHWPAEQLLKYGEETLGALQPDMIFIGGTDPGAFINSFLNETSDGEHHIIFTQNALADNSYIDYLNFVYGDKLQLPTPAESDAAFQDYIADVSKRAAHDRDLPDEPPQLAPEENFKIIDGKPNVSGQTAVMSINERILARIVDKNPERSFALEESFSLKSTYKDAAPLGPVMELRAGEENKLTAERAVQAVENWRSNARELLESTTERDDYPRRAWSHMAAAQGNLLLERNFLKEAEETFRLAQAMHRDSPEAAAGLARVRSRMSAGK